MHTVINMSNKKKVWALTRFNKIAKAKGQVASEQGTHWLIQSPTLFSMCDPPPAICVNLVFNHIRAARAVTQYVDNLFHSFIDLCENEYFVKSNLH